MELINFQPVMTKSIGLWIDFSFEIVELLNGKYGNQIKDGVIEICPNIKPVQLNRYDIGHKCSQVNVVDRADVILVSIYHQHYLPPCFTILGYSSV